MDIDTVAEKISVAVKKRRTSAPTSTPSPKPKSTSTTLTEAKRFVDNGDQTITDTSTGLMWTKDANLAGRKTWQKASDYVASMNEGEGTFAYTDWRLPAKEELESLVKDSKGDPYSWLASQGFTNVQSNGYWSSTSYAGDTSDAWIVSMVGGDVFAFGKSSSSYVWPVRSGH
ncbi:DUF1566 domain-containing protein [Candidatus Magnetobacterium casense]|uniref:Lcl C-terminal domain-containing protein n=1 Tax=Candidatus Magnetobacterium casense TaxID=1455061 RepID=UPI001F1A3663|nr:DUF1566 domain-containing protein [Candidatus Magnetobacterium casensis]